MKVYLCAKKVFKTSTGVAIGPIEPLASLLLIWLLESFQIKLDQMDQITQIQSFGGVCDAQKLYSSFYSLSFWNDCVCDEDINIQ